MRRSKLRGGGPKVKWKNGECQTHCHWTRKVGLRRQKKQQDDSWDKKRDENDKRDYSKDGFSTNKKKWITVLKLCSNSKARLWSTKAHLEAYTILKAQTTFKLLLNWSWHWSAAATERFASETCHKNHRRRKKADGFVCFLHHHHRFHRVFLESQNVKLLVQ